MTRSNGMEDGSVRCADGRTTSRAVFLRRAAGAGIAVAATGLPAAGAAAARRRRAATTIKFAHVSPVDSFHNLTAQRFAKLVQQRSNGQLQIQIYPAGQLGSENTYLESLRGAGSPEMGFTSSVLSTWYPAWALLDAPYVFRSLPDAWKATDGSVGQSLREGARKQGFQVFGSLFSAPRNVATTKKQIKGIDDLHGQKIRIPKSTLYTNLFEALGAVPVPMDPAEVYTSLQTGVLDGVEQPLDFLYTFKWYELTKNIAYTQHIYTSTTFLANAKWWDKQPGPTQKLLSRALADALAYGRPIAKTSTLVYRGLLKAAGDSFTSVDLRPFRAAAKPVVDSLAASIPGGTQVVRDLRKAGKTA